jgi:hypothetical protein
VYELPPTEFECRVEKIDPRPTTFQLRPARQTGAAP